MKPRRTIVYVDGFNLYYGALKGTPYRWLDLSALCSYLLPPSKNDVVKIKYFTAKVSATPAKPNTAQHQETYLRALRTIPNVEIVLGHFLTHEKPMRLAPKPSGEPKKPFTVYLTPGGPTRAWVRKTEEKGSDVNLATHLLFDACSSAFDVAALITNDSDLKEPARLVKEDLKRTVGIINPHKHPSFVLTRSATFVKSIRESALRNSLFNTNLSDATGNFSKPPGW